MNVLTKIPALAALGLIGAAVFAGVVALREVGAFQRLGLAAQDYMTVVRAAPATRADPRIAVVVVEERDIVNRGWPLADQILADAIHALGDAKPAAIGIDIYRDRPEGEGEAALEAALVAHPQVVWVTKFPDAKTPLVGPPAILAGTGRHGFADLVIDIDGIVRRTPLFLDDGEIFETSFALVLAAAALADRGVGIAASEENPDHVAIGAATLAPFSGDEGPYWNADDLGYQLPLDYVSGLGISQTLTLTDVLAEDADLSDLEGAIVLIGVAATTVKDDFLTPFSAGARTTTPGVFLHAVIVDQLLRHGLDGAPRQASLGPAEESVWIFLCALSAALIGALSQRPVWFLAALVGIAGVNIGLGLALFFAGVWAPAVPGFAASATSALLGAGYAGWRQRYERGRLMSLFSRHVSGAVAERIWRDRASFFKDGAPKPQRLTATVLFSDIKGFTPLSESLGEEALMAWLNAYMTEMATAVLENGGIVDKYIGDAVMAVYGAPQARTTEAEIDKDARAAAATALRMAEKLAALNERSEAEGLPRIGMRIGLHTGTLVAGSLGARERLEYTVIGDTVNVAARFESAANRIFEIEEPEPEVAIAISEATQTRLGEGFRTKPLGALELKGKSEPMPAFQLVGRNP